MMLNVITEDKSFISHDNHERFYRYLKGQQQQTTLNTHTHTHTHREMWSINEYTTCQSLKILEFFFFLLLNIFLEMY